MTHPLFILAIVAVCGGGVYLFRVRQEPIPFADRVLTKKEVHTVAGWLALALLFARSFLVFFCGSRSFSPVFFSNLLRMSFSQVLLGFSVISALLFLLSGGWSFVLMLLLAAVAIIVHASFRIETQRPKPYVERLLLALGVRRGPPILGLPATNTPRFICGCCYSPSMKKFPTFTPLLSIPASHSWKGAASPGPAGSMGAPGLDAGSSGGGSGGSGSSADAGDSGDDEDEDGNGEKAGKGDVEDPAPAADPNAAVRTALYCRGNGLDLLLPSSYLLRCNDGS